MNNKYKLLTQKLLTDLYLNYSLEIYIYKKNDGIL